MTDKEKAIVMAHTGICMLTEDKFQIFHKYVEELMGRPILTHEMGWLADAIKEKSKVDFMALCADESSGQEPKWIPCSERLPKDNGYYLTTTMYHEVYCDYWEEERFNRTETVIAWMPLPEPYEPSN